MTHKTREGCRHCEVASEQGMIHIHNTSEIEDMEEMFKTRITQDLAMFTEQKQAEAIAELLMNHHKEIVNAQLQKARADWLRSEIEKLDTLAQSLEEDLRWMDCSPSDKSVIQKHIKELRSIITRYKEELKVLESK